MKKLNICSYSGSLEDLSGSLADINNCLDWIE